MIFSHLCLSVPICGKKLSAFTFHCKWSIHSAMQNYFVPIIVEQTGHGERSWDIYSRLLIDGIIFVGTAGFTFMAKQCDRTAGCRRVCWCR